MSLPLSDGMQERGGRRNRCHLGEREQAEELAIVAHINKRYTNDKMRLVLLQSIRYRCPHRYVPCPKSPNDAKHRYHVHEKEPFRLRCGAEGCHDQMQRGEAVAWFAKLVANGTVPREALGMAMTQAASTVSVINAVYSFLT